MTYAELNKQIKDDGMTLQKVNDSWGPSRLDSARESLSSSIYRVKENEHWKDCMERHSTQPRKLWKTIDSLLRRGTSISVPIKTALTAKMLSTYFDDKVNTIQQSFEQLPQPVIPRTCTTSLDKFKTYEDDDIRRMIIASPSKTGWLDPVPSEIIKEFLTDLLPFIARMCTSSLMTGHLPCSQRHAVITPILKKLGTDVSVASNYRPISGLTFLSKLIERLVSRQLINYLETNDLCPINQSAYRKNHSTETVVLYVLANTYAAIDRRDVTLMAMLDQSAAFDLVDHDILLQRLNNTFGSQAHRIHG